MIVEHVVCPPGLDGSEGLLAVLVRAGSATHAGAGFYTDPSLPLQVGSLRHPAGARVEPHHHPVRPRVVSRSSEVLYVVSGRVLADFFTSAGEWVRSVTLFPGDVLVLVAGGHGFSFPEASEVHYVRQGPYSGGDKVLFPRPVSPPKAVEDASAPGGSAPDLAVGEDLSGEEGGW